MKKPFSVLTTFLNSKDHLLLVNGQSITGVVDDTELFVEYFDDDAAQVLTYEIDRNQEVTIQENMLVVLNDESEKLYFEVYERKDL